MPAHTPFSPVSCPVFFTVAVTTHNRAGLLIKAIESVLTQDFSDYEMIVVDDASTDNTEQVVKQCIEQAGTGAPPIYYHRQPTNCGVSTAREVALQHARGEYIVYLDDDDRFAPQFLSIMQRALINAPVQPAFALPARESVRSSPTGEVSLHKVSFGQLTETCLLPGQSYFQKAFGGGTGLLAPPTAIRAVGGWNKAITHGEDIDLLMRLALYGDFLVVPEAKIYLCNHEGPQLTKDFLKVGIGHERLADVYAASFRPYPGVRYTYYRTAARMYYAANARQAGRRCMIKALRLSPFTRNLWRTFVLCEISDFLPLEKRQRLLSHYRHGYQPQSATAVSK